MSVETAAAPEGEAGLSFYESSLTEAERGAMRLAREVKGMDEEIAVLRVKLRTAMSEHPTKPELMLKGIGLLVRAVALRYNLSPASAEELENAVRHVYDREAALAAGGDDDARDA
jgi:hypothetical protein